MKTGLRLATEQDAEAIRRWRNHPEVRQRFIFRDKVDSSRHRAWWQCATADPGRLVLMYLEHDVACGVVTIVDHDPAAGTAEWGFFLDIDALRARAALTQAWIGLERSAIRYAFGDLRLRVLGGRTLARNTSVLALHRRYGFVEVPERSYTVDIDGHADDVIWMELTADRAAPCLAAVGIKSAWYSGDTATNTLDGMDGTSMAARHVAAAAAPLLGKSMM